MSYNQTLQRLFEYRKLLQFSQKEISSVLGITQSHYSKIESGQKGMSFGILKTLQDNSFNVDYIITGVKTETTILDRYLDKCSQNQRVRLYQLILWILRQKVAPYDAQAAERFDYYYKGTVLFEVMTAGSGDKEHSIWSYIRMQHHLTQNEMTAILGIDIKKYRSMEKKKTFPDAEILTCLYEQLGCFPSLFLKNNVCSTTLLNVVWNALSDIDREQAGRFIEFGMQMMSPLQRGD